jgi:hypothetical protein
LLGFRFRVARLLPREREAANEQAAEHRGRPAIDPSHRPQPRPNPGRHGDRGAPDPGGDQESSRGPRSHGPGAGRNARLLRRGSAHRRGASKPAAGQVSKRSYRTGSLRIGKRLDLRALWKRSRVLERVGDSNEKRTHRLPLSRRERAVSDRAAMSPTLPKLSRWQGSLTSDQGRARETL